MTRDEQIQYLEDKKASGKELNARELLQYRDLTGYYDSDKVRIPFKELVDKLYLLPRPSRIDYFNRADDYCDHETEFMSLFALAMHPNFSLDWLDTVTYDKLKEITIWATETLKWVACNMTMAKLK